MGLTRFFICKKDKNHSISELLFRITAYTRSIRIGNADGRANSIILIYPYGA